MLRFFCRKIRADTVDTGNWDYNVVFEVCFSRSSIKTFLLVLCSSVLLKKEEFLLTDCNCDISGH